MTIAALAALFLSAASVSDFPPLRAPCVVTGAGAIELASRSIRIGDVVDLSCLAPDVQSSIATLELAHAPLDRREVELSHAAIASLARRRAPLLEGLEGDDERALMLRFAAPESDRSAGGHAEPMGGSCFSLAAPLSEGDIVTGEVLSPTPCIHKAN